MGDSGYLCVSGRSFLDVRSVQTPETSSRSFSVKTGSHFKFIYGELSKRLQGQHLQSCNRTLIVTYYLETYRSGHNELDSKFCGELSVSSIKKLVTVRVFHGSKN